MTDAHKAGESLLKIADAAISAHQPELDAYAQWSPQRVRNQATHLIANAESGAQPGAPDGVSVSLKGSNDPLRVCDGSSSGAAISG